MKFPSKLILFDEIFKTIHYYNGDLVTVSYKLVAFNIKYVAQFSVGRRYFKLFMHKNLDQIIALVMIGHPIYFNINLCNTMWFYYV